MGRNREVERPRHANAEKIRELMDTYGLSTVDLAEMAGVKKNTVYSWFRPSDSVFSRNPPDQVVELVRLKCDRLYEL